MENDSQLSQEDKREFRRKRRQRNQIAAYLLLLLIIGLVAAGIVCGVRFYTQYRETAAHQELPDESSVIGDMLGSEPPLEVGQETLSSGPETEPQPTPEELFEEMIEERIAEMSLEDKVAGLFWVTPENITGVNTAVQAGDGTREALERYAVGGIIYYSKNIRSKEQLTEMISNTRQFSRYPLLFGVMEEGGSVNNVAEKGLAEKAASAQEIGQSGDPANAYQAGNAIGAYLSELGFDVDFAPVADLADVERSVMQKRAYGADAATVSPFVVNMIQGLESQGITSCLKHFPGMGSTRDDTHKGLTVLDRTAEEFRAEEFAVFQSAIDAGAEIIMVGHAAAPALTGDNTPCSMSEVVVTDILRNELGFQGVIISDEMNMTAISDYYEADDAAIRALRAGCDMILMPDDFELAYNGVLGAVQSGVISEERINDALRRVYRIKLADQMPEA